MGSELDVRKYHESPTESGASGDSLSTVEFFSGDTADVPDGWTYTYLEFHKLVVPGAVGDDLLDLTDPTHPFIIEPGHYAINLAVNADPGAGLPAPVAYFWFGLDVTRPDNYGTYQDLVGPLVLTGTSRPVISQSLVYYCPAGTTVLAGVRTNFASTYGLEGAIQRLNSLAA